MSTAILTITGSDGTGISGVHSSKGEQLVSPMVFEAIEQLLLPLCTVVLAASDVPIDPRRHGQANQLGSAVAYYLSIGETDADAMQHAKAYLSQQPSDYIGGNPRRCRPDDAARCRGRVCGQRYL